MASKKAASKPDPIKSGNPIVTCQPRGDRVLVRRDMPKTESAGGILLPDSFTEGQKKNYGTVVRVGPGNRGPDGDRIPIDLEIGDRVLLTGYSGMDISDPANPTTQDEYVILREDDILAVL